MSKVITLNDGNDTYTLEYTLRAATLAEQDGFVLDRLGDSPATMIPLLFHWALYKHHPKVNKMKSLEVYKGIRGKNKLIKALAEMYSEAVNALVDTDDEDDDEGNASWTLA